MNEAALQVGLGERSYPLFIGAGLLSQLGQALQERFTAKRFALISDQRVAELYGAQALAAIRQVGLAADLFTFPAGEAHKRLATIEALANQLSQAGLNRSHALVALGGGVSGDMAGFLAAIYMRGLPFAQVPTTLLAQVDSSVGGKTGVDLVTGKNLIGAFYQPGLVLIDSTVLRSLPQQELLSGLAEVIKYGASLDAEFFAFLRSHREQILALDEDAIRRVIGRCCELKAQIVAQDEREGGLRRVLNFGHTVGHAVEAAAEFRLPHGLAVAIGMVAVTRLAVTLGQAPAAMLDELIALLHAYGLPTRIPGDLNLEQILAFMHTDKKQVQKRLLVVLPTGLGQFAFSDQVDDGVLRETIRASY